MTDSPAAEPSRRSVLDLLLGAGLVGFLSSAIYPVLRYLTPAAVSAQGGPLKLNAEDRAKLERDHYVILRNGPARILVFEDAGQTLRALDAKCTHEGCTVRYVPGESVVWCACHNGRFDLDGRVISGPPPRPLAAYKVSGSLTTKVVVARGEGA
jgi:cytochrome b6-f complex iron-sulfur subunit